MRTFGFGAGGDAGRLKATSPRAVRLAEGSDLVSADPLGPGERAPLTFRPAFQDVDLEAWAAGNRELLENRLAERGALLFRGFSIGSVAKFERFAQALCPELFGEYGDLPTEKGGEKVYKSTPYPADKTILFHNESSHMHRWPLKQWFYCIRAASERGETPIVDCRAVYQQLAPEIRDELARKGLLYVRNFIPSLDVGWQDFFRNRDRSAVEDYCRRSGIACEWLPDDGLRIEQRSPAVAVHPRTGETVFFNQLQLHHASFLEPEVRSSLLTLYGEHGLPRNVYFGDGSPIADEVAQEIERLYWRLAVQFPWQEQDVLMVDNMITAHARNPYSGQRQIAVAMWEMVSQQDLAREAAGTREGAAP